MYGKFYNFEILHFLSNPGLPADLHNKGFLKPTCTLLVCGGAESNQSELGRVGNFLRLSAGTADGPLDMFFFVRGSFLQFQRVHESTLLIRTCSECSGIKLLLYSCQVTKKKKRKKEKKTWVTYVCNVVKPS